MKTEPTIEELARKALVKACEVIPDGPDCDDYTIPERAISLAVRAVLKADWELKGFHSKEEWESGILAAAIKELEGK